MKFSAILFLIAFTSLNCWAQDQYPYLIYSREMKKDQLFNLMIMDENYKVVSSNYEILLLDKQNLVIDSLQNLLKLTKRNPVQFLLQLDNNTLTISSLNQAYIVKISNKGFKVIDTIKINGDFRRNYGKFSHYILFPSGILGLSQKNNLNKDNTQANFFNKENNETVVLTKDPKDIKTGFNYSSFVKTKLLSIFKSQILLNLPGSNQSICYNSEVNTVTVIDLPKGNTKEEFNTLIYDSVTGEEYMLIKRLDGSKTTIKHVSSQETIAVYNGNVIDIVEGKIHVLEKEKDFNALAHYHILFQHL